MITTRFQVGDTVGDYKILKVLGAGGTGCVFQVEHAVTGRVEAMKILLDHVAADDTLVKRFQREIRMQASLNHPNIAAAYNAFCESGVLVMVMESVPGTSLRTLLEQGRMNPPAAVDCLCQALAALEHSHGRGIIHRDVSPANILITDSGQVKLTDFGLARRQEDRQLTQKGMPMGSLYYMAPEQIRGLVTVDHRADIYSAGAVLFETLTGRKPFNGDDSFALMRAHVEEQPKAPGSLASGICEHLDRVVLRALAKRPEDRFSTAREFREALQVLLRQPGGLSESTRLRRPIWLRAGRSARFAIVAAVIVGMALAAQVYRDWWHPTPPTPSKQVLHAPSAPEFALKPPYLLAAPGVIEIRPTQKHPVRRFFERLNPLRRRTSPPELHR